MASTYDIIRRAILNKEQVIATYNGYRREMCPHAIGTKNGRQQVLFYQFGGYSSSGLGPPGSPSNWRCIPISRLSNVETRKGEWYTAPNYSRPQTCVDHVDIDVEHEATV
jgi:hypothetical protein